MEEMALSRKLGRLLAGMILAGILVLESATRTWAGQRSRQAAKG